MSTTLATALWVAQHWPGARVFPVVGKHPAFRELGDAPWNEAATTDPDQIAAWFAGTDYGVGVTGILALDCDRDPSSLGHEFGAEVVTGVRWRGNPDRMTVAFAQPDKPFGDGRWRNGEVKGSGYVVLPPSRHTSDACDLCTSGIVHGYEWEGDWQVLPVLPASVESALDGLVGRQGTLVAVEVGEGEFAAWETAGAPCRAVLRVLDEFDAGMAGKDPSRHDLMAHHMIRVLRHGEQGHEGVAKALDHIWAGFWLAVKDDKKRKADPQAEYDRALVGARKRIASEGLTPAEAKGCCGHREPDPLVEGIFTSTDLLSDLRQFAYAKGVSPCALLGSALAVVVAETPHEFTTNHHAGSLNLLVALTGESGSGKTTAWHAASEYLAVDDPIAAYTGAGSGEGLIASFLTRNPDEDHRKETPWVVKENPNLALWVGEVDQQTATNLRNGATGDAILRMMWGGEMVGTQNADAERRRHLPRGSYRLGYAVGVQPLKARAMLGTEATAGGMAQRWLWMPTASPDAPHPSITVKAPAPLLWKRPTLAGHWGGAMVTFPEDMLMQVRTELWEVQTGRRVRGENDTHATQMRMKVAAALTLLHGDTTVTPKMWGLAGEVMKVSDRTRDMVLDAMSRETRRKVRAEGALEVDREEGRDEARVKRGAAACIREVRRHEDRDEHRGAGCPKGCLTRALRKYRDIRDECIALALTTGLAKADDHYRVQGGP